MRSRVQDEVVAAKKKISADKTEARAEIERQTPELAAQITRAVLEGPSSLRGGTSPR
jgi:F0F1-type ATP synthase membrane subunit b/b'